MWHHPATVKARLRRWSGVVFRPVAIALDPRLEGLEGRIVERIESRLEAVERHVATDADVIAEMSITQSRLLARLEARLAALEARQDAGAAVAGGSRPVATAWAIAALGGLRAPARVAVSAPGDAGLPLALVGLGHEVLLVDGDAVAPAHPRVRHDVGTSAAGEAVGRDLDAAVVLCAEGAAGPAPVDAALAARLAARLRPGGMLLLASPQSTAAGLDELLGGLRVVERLVAAPGTGGVWEVARDGGAAGDGVALLRADATR
jgi:hypothetical protein